MREPPLRGSHVKKKGMLFGKFELNLEKETNLSMARTLFDPIK